MLATILCLALAGCGGAETQDPVRHLVLICIDTVRHDAFHADARNDSLSPYTERAQVYDQAHSVASWTIPAVATVFTGWYPTQHQAGAFEVPVANLERDLPNLLSEDARTLAEELADEGFRTAAFSGHSWLEAETGLEQGFRQVHSRTGWRKVVDRFGEWLDQKHRQPRDFAYLHFMEAHDWHLQAEEELRARLAAIPAELHARLLEQASEPACARPDSEICLRNLVYLLGVRESRRAVGGVLNALQTRGRFEDTLVVLFSDHGEEFWEHREAHKKSGDPRGVYGYGHGQSLYQELLHVPLLVWHPRMGGARHADLVSLVDVFPSILDWLGLPVGEAAPGKRLPVPNGVRRDRERVIYASGIAYGPQAVAARRGDIKSIFTLHRDRPEIFDLARDPGETHALEDDTLLMEADALTGDYLDLPGALPVARLELGDEEIRRLQAIGYLQGVDSPEPDAGDSVEHD